jgi:hypothetical protein
VQQLKTSAPAQSRAGRRNQTAQKSRDPKIPANRYEKTNKTSEKILKSALAA